MTKQIQEIDYKISFHKKELEKYTQLKEIVGNNEPIFSSDSPIINHIFIIDSDLTVDEVEKAIFNSNLMEECMGLEDYHTESCKCNFGLEDYGVSAPEDTMRDQNNQIREWSKEIIDLHQKLQNHRQDNDKFENLVDLLTEAGYNVSIKNGDIQIDKE